MLWSKRPRSYSPVAPHLAALTLQDMADASAQLAFRAERLGKPDLALKLAMAAPLTQARLGGLSGGAAPSA